MVLEENFGQDLMYILYCRRGMPDRDGVDPGLWAHHRRHETQAETSAGNRIKSTQMN